MFFCIYVFLRQCKKVIYNQLQFDAKQKTSFNYIIDANMDQDMFLLAKHFFSWFASFRLEEKELFYVGNSKIISKKKNAESSTFTAVLEILYIRAFFNSS